MQKNQLENSQNEGNMYCKSIMAHIANKIIHTSEDDIIFIHFSCCTLYISGNCFLCIKIYTTSTPITTIFFETNRIEYCLKFDRWITVYSNFNDFIQSLLNATQQKNKQQKHNNRNITEYIFSFQNYVEIMYFTKLLNEKTWKMFADVNFYKNPNVENSNVKLSDVESPNVKLSDVKNHIKKQFKIIQKINKHDTFSYFLKFLKKNVLYITNLRVLCCEVEIFEIEIWFIFRYFSRDGVKKCLWLQSDPNFNCIDIFFTNDPYYWYSKNDMIDIYNLWRIVACGLCNSSMLNKPIKSSPLMQTWTDFLTNGCYDPRILIYIEQFSPRVKRSPTTKIFKDELNDSDE